jgi:hypothetical protein
MASADNVTNFATLQAALTTPGLNAGDVIQIEPGSAPGNIVNADLPAVAGLTVRGDPTAALSAIPQFTVSDAFTVGAAQEGFTFRNVNIGLIQTPADVASSLPGGNLAFTADGTIAGSVIVNINADATAVQFGSADDTSVQLYGAADLLTNTTLVNQGGEGGLLDVSAPNGSSTIVSDNVFEAVNTGGGGLVIYFSNGLSSGQVSSVTDQFTGNTIVGAQAVNAETGIEVVGPLIGLTIQDNTISLAPPPNGLIIPAESGILFLGGALNTRIIGNVINLTGSFNAGGISVNSLEGADSLFIAGNQINAGPSGTGLGFGFGQDPVAITAVVQGNDFHNDGIGVAISGYLASTYPGSTSVSVASIDLGGGSQGSLGGNDFRSFTAPASSTSGAIVVNLSRPVEGAPTTGFSSLLGVIPAQKNSFAAGVDPRSVVYDGSDSAGMPGLDVSNNLTGNAAFVAALYADLLKRAGDTSNPNDAGGLIAALNSGALTQAAAASALVHSTEALGVQVDGLYLKLLGRPSDAPGRAGFVSFMQNGGSLEQVIALMVSSPEYAALTDSEAGFVQSLYANLLGRTASDAEIAGYVAALPSQGRAGVALDFLQSPEFRTDVVDQFYSATPTPTSVAALFPPLLHRAGATTTAEINGYVASGLSVLDIETAFISSPEFFVDG